MKDHERTQQLIQELSLLREKVATLETRQAQRQYSDEASLQKAILDAIPDPAWLKDKAGRFLAVNAAWCRFFGVEAQDVLGKISFDFLPRELAEKFQEQDQGIVRLGRPLSLAESLRDKEGRIVWFETIKSPVCNDRGEVVGTAGIARDITASKQLEESLRQSEDRYRSLFDGITEGFALHEIICDEKDEPSDYRFLEINPAFEHLTGLKRSEIIGKTMREVLPDEDLVWVKIYGKVALTGQPVRFDNHSAAPWTSTTKCSPTALRRASLPCCSPTLPNVGRPSKSGGGWSRRSCTRRSSKASASWRAGLPTTSTTSSPASSDMPIWRCRICQPRHGHARTSRRSRKPPSGPPI